MTTHQQNQIEVIDSIEKQINENTLNFSTISPVSDFNRDPRICLTSIHFPKPDFLQTIIHSVINPLKEIEPSYFYYPDTSLHMTIKNIKVISDPPNFTDDDIKKAQNVFTEVIPHHKKFNVYFYRLLMFPNNLALIGTTDPELDEIFFDLDRKLNEAGIPDDKKYSNAKYYFSNMTLVRFQYPSERFKNKVRDISEKLSLSPYEVNSVSLVSCNAVFNKRNIIQTWKLQ